jgi:hypothetical protein
MSKTDISRLEPAVRLDKHFRDGARSITSMTRRQHHEQRPGQQEDLQKGTGKNPEGKKGRKKDQKGRKKEITGPKKTLQRYVQGLLQADYRSVPVSTGLLPRHIYFLMVGHMQFVGVWFPTQTLAWQNAILPVDFTLPDVPFVFLIACTFFLSTAL